MSLLETLHRFFSDKEGTGLIICADNLTILPLLPSESIDLIYIDPPFNTGKVQRRLTLRTKKVEKGGDRTGFGGRRYETLVEGQLAYPDEYDDYLGFLAPRLLEAYRILKREGTLYLHIDYREAHYCKVFLLDAIFGRQNFLNEIIWAYDYGGRPKNRWAPKHDTIFVYVKDRRRYYFSTEEVERLPYMAPGLVSSEKAARGKLPTDVWWHTIVPTHSREKTGYPTQKPLGILRRIVAASAPPGGVVLDFFAGSGTAGAAAIALGRRFILIDHYRPACEIMRKRLSATGVSFIAVSSDSPEGLSPDDWITQ